MAKLKPFRCLNKKCASAGGGRPQFDFAAEVPVCPKCKWDGRKPGFENCVVPLVVIHFDLPDNSGARSQDATHPSLGRRACDPGKPIRGGRGTGNPTAATCPACQDSESFKAALAAWQDGGYADFVLTLNKDGTIERGE